MTKIVRKEYVPVDSMIVDNVCKRSVKFQDQKQTGKVECGGNGTRNTSCPEL